MGLDIWVLTREYICVNNINIMKKSNVKSVKKARIRAESGFFGKHKYAENLLVLFAGMAVAFFLLVRVFGW